MNISSFVCDCMKTSSKYVIALFSKKEWSENFTHEC